MSAADQDDVVKSLDDMSNAMNRLFVSAQKRSIDDYVGEREHVEGILRRFLEIYGHRIGITEYIQGIAQVRARIGDILFYDRYFYEEAILEYESALDLDPLSEDALNGLTAACLQGKRRRAWKALPFEVMRALRDAKRVDDLDYVCTIIKNRHTEDTPDARTVRKLQELLGDDSVWDRLGDHYAWKILEFLDEHKIGAPPVPEEPDVLADAPDRSEIQNRHLQLWQHFTERKKLKSDRDSVPGTDKS
jgi:tetratricopeptide (TPR) repeat protein